MLSPPASSSVDYCLNRWALRWCLKKERVVSGGLRSTGRLFHVRGPLMAKLRWPVAVRACGTSRVPDAVERSCWRPCTEWAGTRCKVDRPITDGLNTDLHLDIGNGVSLEKVDKFCYLEDMLDADGGCDSAVTARVRSAWNLNSVWNHFLAVQIYVWSQTKVSNFGFSER